MLRRVEGVEEYGLVGCVDIWVLESGSLSFMLLFK